MPTEVEVIEELIKAIEDVKGMVDVLTERVQRLEWRLSKLEIMHEAI